MSSTISQMLDSLRSQVDYMARVAKDTHNAISLIEKLNLTHETSCNPSYGTIWFSTTSREDLVQLLSLAPPGQQWAKSVEGVAIRYQLTIGDNDVSIFVTSGALPPTCKCVEVEVEVPAQPARMEKRMKILCNEPVDAPEGEGNEGTNANLVATEQDALDEARGVLDTETL